MLAEHPLVTEREEVDLIRKWGLFHTLKYLEIPATESQLPQVLRRIGISGNFTASSLQLSFDTKQLSQILGKVTRDDGEIIKCFEEVTEEGIVIDDELRKALLQHSEYEDEEMEDIFANCRNLLVFKVFQLLVLGGICCQYEDEVKAYVEMTKKLFSKLVPNCLKALEIHADSIPADKRNLVVALIRQAPLPTALALYSSRDAVIELNNKNFNQVLESNHVWMVEFYAPWCGHCKALAPEYKKAATSAGGIVKIAAVNCDEDSNKPICGQYGIQGFPTIKFFPGDKTGSKKLPMDYQGERKAKAILDYAVSRIPSRVKQFKSLSEGDKVLLVSEKKTPQLYKALALEFPDLQFGESKEKMFGVESIPSLVYLPKDGEPVIYDGQLKYANIVEFLSKYSTPESASKGKKTKKEQPKKEEIKKDPFDPRVPEINTLEEFEAECINKLKNVYSGLCFFAFLPPLEKEFEESVKQHEEFISILSGAKKAHYDAGEAVYFVWRDGFSKESQEMAKKFGLSSDLPSAMLLSPSKKLFRQFLGSFDKESIVSFVKETAGGKARVFPYEEMGLKKSAGCSSEEESGQCKKPPNGNGHDEL